MDCFVALASLRAPRNDEVFAKIPVRVAESKIAESNRLLRHFVPRNDKVGYFCPLSRDSAFFCKKPQNLVRYFPSLREVALWATSWQSILSF
ncbi:hypothetical protein [Helicobacter sp. 23-1045]